MQHENAHSFWTNIFVQKRELSSEEKDVCEMFDDFTVCRMRQDDVMVLNRLLMCPNVNSVKVRQLAVLIAFGRGRHFEGDIGSIIGMGLWMRTW